MADDADYTYVLSTDVGKVRLKITDNDLSSIDEDTAKADRSALFNDTEIEAFLAMESDDLDHAAAMALVAIATSAALIEQRVRVEGLDRDTKGVADSLLALAKVYNPNLGSVADIEPADAIVGMDLTNFAYRQRIVDEAVDEVS